MNKERLLGIVGGLKVSSSGLVGAREGRFSRELRSFVASTSRNSTRRFDVSGQNREKEKKKKKKKEGRFPKIRPLDNNLWKFDLSDNDLWKSLNSTSPARKFDLTCSFPQGSICENGQPQPRFCSQNEATK
ncbi:heme oxygenase 3 [Striga asiatica]|uniref:Heme oxygenase 3 n=1 Tax=Striga asiatica TaxID=4170 RepID=A0A5A7R4D6_STRAF|nr:heme oxygenase 3 [Striga asiatica]